MEIKYCVDLKPFFGRCGIKVTEFRSCIRKIPSRVNGVVARCVDFMIKVQQEALNSGLAREKCCNGR